MSVFLKLTSKGVNDKRLFKSVDAFAYDCLCDDDEWCRGEYPEGLVGFVEEYLLELADEGAIEQYKVVCDDRNNTNFDIMHGLYNFSIQFKQKHCLNFTELLYRVSLV